MASARKQLGKNRRQIFSGPMKVLQWRVKHTDRDLHFPENYKYDNALPKEVVKPAVLFGNEISAENLSGAEKLNVFTDWLVSKNNERFTKVIANRLWKKVFGFVMLAAALRSMPKGFSARRSLPASITSL